MSLIQQSFISLKLEENADVKIHLIPETQGYGKGLEKMADCVWVENIIPPESCITWVQTVFSIERHTWLSYSTEDGNSLCRNTFAS